MNSTQVAAGPDGDGEIYDLLAVIWRGRWLVLALGATFALSGALYAALATPWYRAEVLMAQSKDRSTDGLMSQFGGLASLAGISVGGGENAEPLALMKSLGFAREFIQAEKLETVLLSRKWDAAEKRWKGPQEDWPDVRDAVEYFDEEVRQVVQDKKTGLVTLAIEWKDPVVAADWANKMASRLNSRMRERAIAESTENIGFLKAEMSQANLISLQQSIGKILEMELQKLMLARSNRQYSFRIVDPAHAPKKKAKPLIVPFTAVGGFLGLLLGVILLIGRVVLQRVRSVA
jgi:uncharacterized protein involved in exopolysaccharide biosynthesis